MSKTAALIIRRLAQEAANPALDPSIQQLLADARTQLIRIAPDLRAVGEEISDSAWLPDEASGDMAIAAALSHADAAGVSEFVLPVPGTSPRLGVALGEYERLTAAIVQGLDS